MAQINIVTFNLNSAYSYAAVLPVNEITTGHFLSSHLLAYLNPALPNNQYS